LDEGSVPTHDEVFDVLDVLWNTKALRSEYRELALQQAWQESPIPKVARYFGILPVRPSTAMAKRQFEETLFSAVYKGLEQVEKMRRGKTLDENLVGADSRVRVGTIMPPTTGPKIAKRLGVWRTPAKEDRNAVR
jgi:hypothetical protein